MVVGGREDRGHGPTEDPRYGLYHMLNEIIRENNAWFAGMSARRAQPPDVTPSS